MHVLGGVGSDHADFLVLSAFAAPVFGLACKDDVGCMLVGELIMHDSDCGPNGRLRRRAGWQRRREPFAFGDSGEPVALPGGVVGQFCTAVELAGRIKGLLIGESG